MIFNIVENKIFKNFIIFLIILNAITLGLETSSKIAQTYGAFLEAFDIFVITVFTIEIILRILAYKSKFFKDGWSLFDLFIVIISLAPANEGFEIFRILRVLRIFRLVTVIPQFRKVVSALLGTIPAMASIAALMGLFFYIFAVMATNLYGKTHPEFFGNLGESFYTLFQIMTLESWSMGVVKPIMQQHPYAWAFFIPFIFIATFIMINLIVAVVVDAMNEINTKDKKSLEDEILELKNELKEIKELLKK